MKILKHKDFNFLNELNNDAIWKTDNNFRSYTHFIGASYDHYTAIIHAYESGANSVLIMEDDCTFINDVSYIQWALNNYPKDADVVKFGYLSRIHIKKLNNLIEKNKKYYNNILVKGFQLYGICNREIMKKYINLQSKSFKCIDNIHIYLKCNHYVLIQPIALDYVGNKIDILNGFENKYTLLENLN